MRLENSQGGCLKFWENGKILDMGVVKNQNMK